MKKTFVLLGSAFLTMAASAAEFATSATVPPTKIELSINTLKKTAEVLYEVKDPLSDVFAGYGPKRYRKGNIEGLTYNVGARAIELESEGRIVVCAHVKERGPRGRLVMIKPTGDCKLGTKKVGETVIDGIGRYKEATYNIVIEEAN